MSRILGHVAYGVLYIAPIAVAVSFNPAYAYWLLSGLSIVSLVAWLWSHGGWHRFAAWLLNAGTAFANLMLGASLYVLGVGFNEQFFYHLDSETRAIARQVQPLATYGAWAYLALICVMPLTFGWRRWEMRGRLPGRIAAVVAIVGVVAYAPLLSAVSFAVSRAEESSRIETVLRPSTTVDPIAIENPRNLVLIFAESLEATYGRADIFGDDFTPALTALANLGANFEDMREVNNSGSTITGMVGAMCAMPLRSPMPWEQANAVLPNVDVPLAGEICLGDVLAAHGYRTVFMGGAPLGFAGKGKFLAEHGFAEVYGLAHFLDRLDDPDYRTGWGIYDDSLIEFAMRKIDELTGQASPFALALLTLDTHHPSGYPSASCRRGVGTDSEMEFAIRCSDRLLGEFIRTLHTRHDNLVVALVSDHLSHRNQLYRTLRRHANERRLRFSVWGSDIEPMRIDRRGTHYDVMPTLLDFLGFENWLRHNLGASLLRYDSPWFAFDGPPPDTVTQDLPSIRLQADSRIVFEAKGPTVHIDGKAMLATHQGLELKDAVFAVEFDARGNIMGFRNADAADRFMAGAKEGMWVGVSSNDRFNRELVPDEPTKLAYFAGCFGTAGFVAGPLWWRESVDVARVVDGCRSKTP